MSSDPRSIIRKVLITEKGTVLRETLRQYYFEWRATPTRSRSSGPSRPCSV
jgi:hypothetical protein